MHVQIDYEVNAKSRLEIKRDFVFSLNMTHEKILLRTTLIKIIVGLRQ